MAGSLGLDCGGSGVRAMVLDGEGRVVFEGEGGPGNVASVDRGVVERSFREALEGVPEVDAVCACVAGLLSSSDEERIRGLLESLLSDLHPLPPPPPLRARGGGAVIDVRPDFHAAWEVAREGCDVLVIAGTGVLVCSESGGEIVKSGGGGVLFGDEGSVSSVGRSALQGQIVSALSLPASEAFWCRVESVFGSRAANEIVAALYRSGSPAKMFADLAGVVASDAAAEEDYAVFAVAGAVTALKSEVEAHALRYQKDKLGALRIGLTGGLWKVHPIFFEWFGPFEEEPRVRATKRVIEVEPVVGACRLAARRGRGKDEG